MYRNDTPDWVREVFGADPRIVTVREYADGWVPHAYRWPAPGTAAEWVRDDDGNITARTFAYDRKRSRGRGPTWVAYSARGGRLASR